MSLLVQKILKKENKKREIKKRTIIIRGACVCVCVCIASFRGCSYDVLFYFIPIITLLTFYVWGGLEEVSVLWLERCVFLARGSCSDRSFLAGSLSCVVVLGIIINNI